MQKDSFPQSLILGHSQHFNFIVLRGDREEWRSVAYRPVIAKEQYGRESIKAGAAHHSHLEGWWQYCGGKKEPMPVYGEFIFAFAVLITRVFSQIRVIGVAMSVVL